MVYLLKITGKQPNRAYEYFNERPSYLEELVNKATSMGLNPSEIDGMRTEYHSTTSKALENTGSGAVEAAQLLGYAGGLRYISRTVDGWHKK